ncbi:RNA polymerase sigma-24 factor [Gluconacetobacter sacchari DSM 12717]|uniref:Sigma-70 family RNA polymerase sigma factor n=2 Tax=Gluconacetobacter sacchari TaxID=92759 RepID=A0A7W4NP65_9PROT|nr:sigma-70 family RNA polymerase sigma factor [Gluconacetobacter sacchari]MBB2158908.1 sigma-70 family RNA polymerase sigma factor [Gluconacetobacter sacchari]GBQ23467.1 RNA polymerase sigma-24 factor [Gluconacetobacter sacchari DSM 12717]
MPPSDDERIAWVASQVLPHEAALRTWLRRFRDIDIDDIVQDSYAAMITADIAGIRNPRAYLFTVARSVVLRHYRRARIISITTLTDFDARSIMDEGADAERTFGARQELARLYTFIEELPQRCRHILLHRKIDGLSQREVAQRLGVSESVVEKQLARALRALDALFGETGAERRPADGGPVRAARRRDAGKS